MNQEKDTSRVTTARGSASDHQVQRVPGAFQFGLVLYIILTSDFPTVVQALAFGLEGGAGTEFAAAMLTSATRDLLLVAMIVMLANHPLGILHPLLIALVVWPYVVGIPQVIEDFGGWAGVLAGLPVEPPYYRGLRTLDASAVWTAVAKYNGLEVASLLSIFVGFSMLKPKRDFSRIPSSIDTVALRNILIGLVGISILALLTYLYFRGGLGAHLTSMGRGRFRELAGDGPVMVATDLGAIALYIWVAARPGDVKSPIFLACLAAMVTAQFVSNGSRGSALMVPLVVGIIWSLRRHRIPWKIALIALPIMFLSIGLLGSIRTSSWYGSDAGEAWSTTGWAESFEIAQKELEERRAVRANVPIVERAFDLTDGPLYGQTYWAAVTAWIPRAMWEEKPRGSGSIYAQVFLGESSEGAGIPVSPEAEMYWNFGLPGVILLSIIYGALIRGAYHFSWRRYPNPFAIVFLMIFLTNFSISTKGLIRFEQQTALLFICYVAVAFFVPRVRSVAVSFNPSAAAPPARALSLRHP